MVHKVFDIMSANDTSENSHEGNLALVITLVSLSVIMWTAFKLLLDKYNSVLFFMCILLASYGLGKIFNHVNAEEVTVNLSTVFPPWAFKVILPVVLSCTCIRLSNIKFMGISQIVYVILVGSAFHIINCVIFLFVLVCVFRLTFQWGSKSVLLLFLSAIMYQPELTIEKLENKGGDVKYVQAILKAEVLLNVSIAFTLTDIIEKYMQIQTAEYVDILDLIIFILVQCSGIIVGIVLALPTHVIYSYVQNHNIATALLSFPVCYLVYSSAELLQTSGCAATALFGVFTTVVAKLKIKPEVEQYSKILWALVFMAVTSYMTFAAGFALGAVRRDHDFRMICFSFGIFVTTLMTRTFVCSLLFPLVYKRKTKWSEVGLAILGPYRGINSLLIAVRNATDDTDESYQILVIIIIVILMSMFLNVILFDWVLDHLDVFQLSRPQITNMNMAVEKVNKCRGNMIFAEKLDRIVVDANWGIVSRVTNFTHPYKDRLKGSDLIDVFKEDVKIVECPRCGALSVAPPTKKELDELARETRLRVIKAQQVSYLKQRDSGTLTIYGFKFLTSFLYLGTFSNDITVNTDDLRIVANDLKCTKRMDRYFCIIHDLTMETYEWQPSNHCRLKCYHLVTSQSFRIVMALTSLLDMFGSLVVFYMYVTSPNNFGTYNWSNVELFIGGASSIGISLFYLINVLEFMIQILGLGIMQYFSRRVFVIEFFSTVIIRTLQIGLFIEQCYVHWEFMNLWNCRSVVIYMNLLMIMRVTRFYIFGVSLIPTILSHIRDTLNKDLLKKYDIGKAYLVGLDRVLKYLNQLTSNTQVLEEIRREIETNRQKVTKELGTIQKEHPTIAITVKTKHAIRHVINSISDCATGMQDEGILDYIEHKALEKAIGKIKERLNELTVIVPPSPINIMKGITWLQGDQENTEIFLDEAQMSSYDYNDVLIRNGDDPVGLYILVSGLLKATYVPSPTSIQLAAKFGVVPNYDFFENFKFDQSQEEYIVSGNVIGELGVVTGRRYDMTVSAETAVQLYYIPWYVMKAMHETQSGQELIGKIWKRVAIRISVTLLQYSTNYRHWNTERLLGFLQRGIMANLKGIVAVNLDQKVEEAILIEGVAMDVINLTIIYGPYRIPKTTTKLLLPDHKAWGFQTVYETKLFIILTQTGTINDLLESKESETDLFLTESYGDQEAGKPKKKLDKSRKVGFQEE